MKRKSGKRIWLCMLLVSVVFFVSACGKEGAVRLVNEVSFSLEDVSDLTVSYDDETVTFFTNEDESLVIKEYMNKDSKGYYARIDRKSGSIHINEGKKPVFKGGFIRYVEVYLPSSYSSNIKVTTTDGDIDMSELVLNLESVRVDTTSGTLTLDKAAAGEIYLSSTSGKLMLGELAADQIRIETTQGAVVCEKIEGEVAYTSTSGNAEFLSASGSGTFRANNSGALSVNYDEVTGDLAFFNKNDDVQVSLPEDLEFEFEAITKNGRIDTDFQGNISVNGDLTSGTVGSSPTVTVKVETKNGNIEVGR